MDIDKPNDTTERNCNITIKKLFFSVDILWPLKAPKLTLLIICVNDNEVDVESTLMTTQQRRQYMSTLLIFVEDSKGFRTYIICRR
jgi:hypothetical protein